MSRKYYEYLTFFRCPWEDVGGLHTLPVALSHRIRKARCRDTRLVQTWRICRLESATWIHRPLARVVIDEVMRMLLPASGIHQRECERVGIRIEPNEIAIPVGADNGTSLFSVLRNSRISRSSV